MTRTKPGQIRTGKQSVARSGKAVPVDPIADVRERIASVQAELSAYSRAPFLRVLADFLGCSPDPVIISALAKADPLKWAQATKIFAELGGYHPKLEVTETLIVEIRGMSDAELLQKREELRAKEIELGKDSYTDITHV